MRSFTELSKVKKTAEGSGSFLIRWRGKQEGPYSESVIDSKLTTNEISLIHEISYNGQWILIRDYIAAKKAILEAQRQEHEKQESLLQKERERHTHQGVGPQIIYQDTNPPFAKGSHRFLFDSPVVKKTVRGFIVVVFICAALWLVLALFSSVVTTRQRLDPNLRQATKKAWRDIQVAEIQAASGNPDPLTYFNQIALNYSQIDADDADPELKDYLLKRVDAAKAARAVLENVLQELQKNEADRNDVANIGQVFGALIGGLASSPKDSNISVDSGMQLGQFLGDLTGSVAGQALISDKDVLSKYADALRSSGNAYDQLGRERIQLGRKLGKKYDIQLLDASN